MFPIGQALAPYLMAGCCAVIELVSHALFIGYNQFTANSRIMQYDKSHIYVSSTHCQEVKNDRKLSFSQLWRAC